MKRTFWFGMIWTLAVVPYIFVKEFTVLIIKTDTYIDSISPISDARIYRFLDRFIDNGLWLYIVIAVPVLTAIAMIRLAWKAGFITKERLRFWRKIRNYSTTNPDGYWGVAGRASIIVGAVYGGYVLYQRGYYIDCSGILYWLASFSGPYGDAIYWSVWYAPLFPLVFTVSAFGYVVATSDTVSDFGRNFRVVAAGVVLFALTIGGVLYFKDRVDLNMRFADIPGISLATEPRHIVLLLDKQYDAQLEDTYYALFTADQEDNWSVPYTKSNYAAIKNYLASKDNLTAMRGAGFEYMINFKTQQLDMRGATRMYAEAYGITDDMIRALFGIRRLRVSPASDEYRQVLDEFADETKYSVRGETALMMSGLYAKFGDLEKAHYWYEKGLTTGKDITEPLKDHYRPPQRAPFYKGAVTGRLVLGGSPWCGARIGITRSNNAVYVAEGKDNAGRYWLMGITDGTITDASGRFTFDHLGEEEYVLLLSVDTSGGKKYRVLNSPGPLKVSEKNPAADAGTIDVVTE